MTFNRLKRRDFIGLLGCSIIAKPMAGRAQQAKPGRIGFLRVGPPPATYIGGFREGLREQGLLEGRDVVIEFALAQNAAQIPKAAAELASSRVDVILAAGTPSVGASRVATDAGVQAASRVGARSADTASSARPGLLLGAGETVTALG